MANVAFRSSNGPSAVGCHLCEQVGGLLAWHGHGMRVVVPDESGQPGVARVIVDEHLCELSDLDDARRDHLMAVVVAVERVLREALLPDKINLAALGNEVPHLHWHVIPRWRDDARFPASPWSQPTDDPARLKAGIERLTMARLAAADLSTRLAHDLPGRVGGEGHVVDRISVHRPPQPCR
jgi:diadenosine tetraphosphate (Ap4A) HIT family hydrolase